PVSSAVTSASEWRRSSRPPGKATRGRAAHTLMLFRATPMIAQCWPPPSTTAFSLPGRLAHRTSSRPPTALGSAGLPPLRLSLPASGQPRAIVEGEDTYPRTVEADRVQGGQPDLKPSSEIERHPEREEQRGTNDIAVANGHHAFVRMKPLQIEKGVDHAV